MSDLNYTEERFSEIFELLPNGIVDLFTAEDEIEKQILNTEWREILTDIEKFTKNTDTTY